jgi:hypothetical protein
LPRKPSVDIEVFRRDVLVRRRGYLEVPEDMARGRRAKIHEFSKSSRRRLMFTARNCEDFSKMLTLTYPSEYPGDGVKVKRDLSTIRKWLSRRGVRGLWVLEFQERGAPHLHIFVTGGWIDMSAVSVAWYRIVGSNDPKHLLAGTQIKRWSGSAARYVSKWYGAKQAQKIVPEGFENVGRFWGTFGRVRPIRLATLRGDFWEMVKAVRAIRGMNRGARSRWTVKPARRDNGRTGFCAWDVGSSWRRWWGPVCELVPE